jgi:nitroreductase
MAIREMLAARLGEGDAVTHKPRLYDLSRAGDLADLEPLLPSLLVLDTIEDQLGDLVAAREPALPLGAAERDDRIERLLDGRSTHEYGRWVHYPWSSRLVHVLPPNEFDELRGDRNRYKQLPAERALMRNKTIAIAGLSVGQAAAMTLALEGVAGHFRLADFDTLSLSNLNRLRAGVHELLINKAVLTARALYELDPYLDIQIFPDGVTETNLDSFLVGADLLVEECDDLFMKVKLRERARELRMPVVMDTSDGGLLDIERFDREPERPILHGLLFGIAASDLKQLSAREKLPFALSVVGVDRVSPSMAASLCEVNVTISTWPQLASSVMLGGALVTDAARRIFVGELQMSGRFYVDLDQLVRDGSAVQLAKPEPLALETVEEARSAPKPIALPMETAGSIGKDELRFLIAHAVLAPSGGNAQPWCFTWTGDHLDCFIDGARARTFLDIDGFASCVALGAAVENIAIAASRLGRSITVEPFPDSSQPLLAARVKIGPRSSVETSALFERIGQRVTNRRLAPPRPLDVADEESLRTALTHTDARLRIVKERDAMARVGEWLGRIDRLRFLTPAMHADLMSEVRWTPDEVARTRDGIDIATLDVTASDRAVMRVLSSPSTMARLKRLGGGRALERPSQVAVAASAALALVTIPGIDRGSYFDGGRQLQRVWLAATSRGLAVQPVSVLPFLLARLDQHGVDEEARSVLQPIRDPFRALFGVPEGHAMILLARLSYADPPSARALRRPVDDVLTLRVPG